MRKIDAGQAITILANLGVIAGIVFLGVEIRQTNELMESEARFNRLSISTEARNILSTNGELAAIFVKVNNDESLTEVEALRFEEAQMRFLANMEWIFQERPDGSRDREYAETILMQALKTGPRSTATVEIFLNRRENFDPEFVRWIETNILLR